MKCASGGRSVARWVWQTAGETEGVVLASSWPRPEGREPIVDVSDREVGVRMGPFATETDRMLGAVGEEGTRSLDCQEICLQYTRSDNK